MRNEADIVRAHDLLVGILLGEAPASSLPITEINLAASVLCWVLQHDHNPTFAENLARIEDQLRLQGFVLERGTDDVPGSET